MDTLKSRQTVSLNGNDIDAKRLEILAYFNNTYTLFEKLYTDNMANDESYFLRADPLRHPNIFYLGHTATFFINKLMLSKDIDTRIDAKLESIFAVGVDEMSWDDLNDKHYDWPSVEATFDYRNKVRALISERIETMPLSLPITQESPFWIILMGCEHERIHIETSSVLIRQLPLEAVKQSTSWSACEESAQAPTNSLVNIPSSHIEIGKEHDAVDYYGWDNEFGKHEAYIPEFQASKYLVSNGEFQAFIDANGYGLQKYWSTEGWGWRTYAQATHPTFWLKKDDTYLYRTLTKHIPLPLNWPVDVNFLEAEAYCNWLSEEKGITLSLPTEDEWYTMQSHAQIDNANIHLKHASSTPVDMYKHGELYDVMGNVWQWTKTPIYPFEGFKTHPIYDDFTAPTYDGQHNLMKGGSWASSGNESLLSSRYAFRRHFFQHAGFRYIQSNYQEDSHTDTYETDSSIAQYCEAHWGEEYFNTPNFPKAIAKHALSYVTHTNKALDIGCGLGRSTYELARTFDKVTGLDFSARFISLATSMGKKGVLNYTLPTEGALTLHKSVLFETFDLAKTIKKVDFWQADASNIKPHFTGYNLILAANLIDRLYSPKRFLQSLSSRMNDGAILVLTSPYSWDENFTAKEEWIGGYKKDGESINTLDGLIEILSDFELIDTKDIPFITRETARKFQHSLTQMSVWKKC